MHPCPFLLSSHPPVTLLQDPFVFLCVEASGPRRREDLREVAGDCGANCIIDQYVFFFFAVRLAIPHTRAGVELREGE